MSIKSDVGAAFKESAFSQLSKESQEFLKGNSDESFGHNDDKLKAMLFVFRSFKWCRGFDEDIDKLYDELKQLPQGDFLIREACFDYPETDDSNIGAWLDNPWNIHVCCTVSLEFNDES